MSIPISFGVAKRDKFQLSNEGIIGLLLALSICILLPIALLGVLYLCSSADELRGAIEFRPTGSASHVRAIAGLKAPGLVPAHELPGHVVVALLLHEDDLFFRHRGVNWPEVFVRIRAFLQGVSKLYGGSSITQQFAKNMFGMRRRWRGLRWIEKLHELVWTFKLERTFTKEEILTLYLNTVHFGPAPLVGIEAASRALLGKGARDLAMHEAVFLFGLLPRPISILTSLFKRQDITDYPYHTAFVKLVDLSRLYAFSWGWVSLKEPHSVSAQAAFDVMAAYNPRAVQPLPAELELALEAQAIEQIRGIRRIVESLAIPDHPVLKAILDIGKSEQAA